ncbi:hypothetical protein L9F63_011753, partial [Diploptera punctata]
SCRPHPLGATTLIYYSITIEKIILARFVHKLAIYKCFDIQRRKINNQKYHYENCHFSERCLFGRL